MNRAGDNQRSSGILTWVSGPVVRARGMVGFRMLELVRVGEEGLIGEVIELNREEATIQVYEDTSGIRPGEPVRGTGAPLSVTLGPGLIGRIFDGIQRPLELLHAASGTFIQRGAQVSSLDPDKEWDFEPALGSGERVTGGDLLGTVPETPLVEHRVLVPPGLQGDLVDVVEAGRYKVTDRVATLRGEKGEVPLTLSQNWRVRQPRPIRERLEPFLPLVTGQRVIDIFLPLAKGGTAAIPGGFGTGKTVTQHNLAKWCDADIIVYIGCGERGNEMTGVLTDFPELKDPRSGRPLMDRTILIANTSNMPVAAREASIYTGVTLAEYYRDMGYDVAVMADSTSRWAEALREISGRLEEMPAEEGFPAYLATRLAEFYERAGRVRTLAGQEASVSIIGAVSPPGGDFSEPVTQHTKRFVRCFWSLDKELASARFFPSINTTESYSEYHEAMEGWWEEQTGENLQKWKKQALEILREDRKLQQIVRLIGEDSLPEEQKMTLLAARLIKDGFLQQNAFDEVDRYALPGKQAKMLRAILRFCDMAQFLVRKGIPLKRVREVPSFRVLRRMKSQVANDETEKIEELIQEVERDLDQLRPGREWAEREGYEGPEGEEPEERAEVLMTEHTRRELYEEAREKEIPGRSTMNKEELARKLAEKETTEGEGE
ncbi:MAG: V-type ATP synthase subunit A [Desulfuromonadales bacterium]|jgi:V/A-type H+-transporting ATPase subunit A